MSSKIISNLFLLTLATAAATATAGPLEGTLSGNGCIISEGDQADKVISFTLADLTKDHGTLIPGDVITHSITLAPNYNITDAACANASVAVSLDDFTPSTMSGLSLNSLNISGPGTTRSSILNNSDPVTVTLSMTVQSTGNIASGFNYSVPFTLRADVQRN